MSVEWSREEVSAGSGAGGGDGGVVFVVDNVVYAVPAAFLDEHPGGHEVLLGAAGTDASEAFHDVGHSSDARDLMRQYRAGSVRQAEWAPVRGARPPPDDIPPPPGGVHWTLPLLVAAAVSTLYYYIAV